MISRLLRWTGKFLAVVTLLLVLLWCFGAVWFDGPFASPRGNSFLAFAWGTAALVLPLLTRSKKWRWTIRLICVLGVLVPWLLIRPTNDRVWLPEYAHEPYAALTGDVVTIENLRNFDYQPGGVIIERWETRTVHLGNLRGVDLVLNFWGSPLMAHPIITFDFGSEGRVAFSIETRRQMGEASSTLGGLYKQFELIYLAADERDVIRLRTNYRPDNDSFLYKLNLPPDMMRDRFLEYIATINQLHDHARFYNVLTTNCTTSIRAQIKPEDRKPFDWRMLANGHMDELLFERGVISSTHPFAEFKRSSNIMRAGKAADLAPDYSDRIRARMEGYSTAP